MKVSRMNLLYMGLADQADASLKVWENLIFGDTSVGASALYGTTFNNGENGTVRLIRTVQSRARASM